MHQDKCQLNFKKQRNYAENRFTYIGGGAKSLGIQKLVQKRKQLTEFSSFGKERKKENT